MNRLNEIEARANAATEGPWEWEGKSDEMWPQGENSLMATGGAEPEYVLMAWGYDAYGITAECDADAEFIAHARTDVPALVAALYEVLDQHQRVVLPTYLPIGRMEDVSICGVCTVEGEPADWPCPTVETIRQHLGDDL